MRLTTVEIVGFKSFGRKTAFAFDPGVTAIVGPNGSGKSNFADAVRWVLGEQNPRSLRCRRSEEVFFAGGNGRPSSGLAQVTITFETGEYATDDDGPDAAEVSVSRRAYRSGESEYYHNRERVRLRDVADVFGRYSLGLDGFAVVGQGAVDAALSARPEDRYQLVEQAAGIAHLQGRLTETQSRLAATEQNLTRVTDLITELTPRLRSLERQARQARERETLQNEFSAGLLRWYAHLATEPLRAHRESLTNRDRATATLGAVRRTLAEKADAARLADERLYRVGSRLSQAEAEAKRWEEQRHAVSAAIEAAQRELGGLETRATELRHTRDHWQTALDDDRRELAAAEARLATIQTEIANLDVTLRDSDAELTAWQLNQKRAADAVSRERARLTSLERQAAAAQARHDVAVARIEQAREQVARAIQEERAVEAEVAAGATRLRDLEARRSVARQALEAAEVAWRDARAEAARLQSELSTATAQLAAAEREVEQSRARADALRASEETGAAYYPGVREILRAANGHGRVHLDGIEGVVGRLITVLPDLEVAIEVALGGHAQDVVVTQWSDAEAAIAHLKSTGAGRATFLPLDTIRATRRDAPASDDGVVGVASALVTTDPRYAIISDFLLGQTLVVESLNVARRVLARCPPSWQIVTRSGEVARPSGSVTGGSVAAQRGVLARQRELRSATRSLATAQENRESAARLVALASDAVNNARLSLASQDRARQLADTALKQLDVAVGDVAHEQRRGAQRLEALRATRPRLEKQLDELEASREAARHEYERIVAETEAATASLEACESEQRRLDAEASERTSEMLAGRAHRERLVEEARSVAQLVTRARERCASIEQRLAEATRAIDATEHNLMDIRRHLDADVERLSEADRMYRAAAASLRDVQAEHQTAASERADTGREEASLLQTVREAEATVSELERHIEQANAELTGLTRQIQLELGAIDEAAFRSGHVRVTLAEGGTIDAPIQAVADADRLRERLAAIRSRLRLLPSGYDAIAEYDATRARIATLSQQSADLASSAATLREAVEETRANMAGRFDATFSEVSRAFSRRFTDLFGGGAARLTIDPDGDRGGIDVVAQVPGKRAQSLAMLSGGERALTAAALLFALIESRPPPFCLLDEVDAALDESNVVRFCDCLRELSQQTQFIVITHNRRTMEAANAIYGLTLEGQCETRLVSLRLPG